MGWMLGTHRQPCLRPVWADRGGAGGRGWWHLRQSNFCYQGRRTCCCNNDGLWGMLVMHCQACLPMSHGVTSSVLWAACGCSSHIARRDPGESWNHSTVGESLCIGSLPLACSVALILQLLLPCASAVCLLFGCIHFTVSEALCIGSPPLVCWAAS